jgi:hypothetical protein
MRSHEKNCCGLHSRITSMLPGTKIPSRQAEPPLNAMQGSNVRASPCSKCQAANCFALSFIRILQETLLCFTSVATHDIVQERIYLGSPFFSTPSARGENFIDLDSLMLSSDRRTMACERRAYYGESGLSGDQPVEHILPKSINTRKVSTSTVTLRINARYAHGSPVTCLKP